MQIRNFWLSKELFLSLAFVTLIAVPAVVLGGADEIYVDKDNKGSETGSSTHPYRSISKGLKHADGSTNIRISKGTYKENITLPKGVKLFGRKKDLGDVVIKADNEDKPAITMKHQTELNFLTVQGGRHGVRVLDDAKVKIYKVKIKDSERDGIHLDRAPRDKKHRALIDSVEIENSDKAGIFSEKRDIVIINSNIHNNEGDGIDFASGTDAWLEHNRINNNHGSGMKVVLDNSSVWTKSNSIRNNKREGVEVNAFGAAGNVGLKKADIMGNARYGVTRLARTAQGMKTFGGIIYGMDVNANRIESNGVGAISPALPSF